MVDFLIIVALSALIIGIYQILPKSNRILFLSGLGIFKFFLLSIILIAGVASVMMAVSYEINDSPIPVNKTSLNTTFPDNPYITSFISFFDETFVRNLSIWLSILFFILALLFIVSPSKKIRNSDFFLQSIDELRVTEDFYPLFDISEKCYRSIFYPKKGILPLYLHQGVLDYYRFMVKDNEFAKQLVAINPKLGMKIIFDQNTDEEIRREVVRPFSHALLHDQKSRLHTEIEEYYSSDEWKVNMGRVPPKYQLLSYILNDLKSVINNDFPSIVEVELIGFLSGIDQPIPKKSILRPKPHDRIKNGLTLMNFLITKAIINGERIHSRICFHYRFVQEIDKIYFTGNPYSPDDKAQSAIYEYVNVIFENYFTWLSMLKNESVLKRDIIQYQAFDLEDDSIIKTVIICWAKSLFLLGQNGRINIDVIDELVTRYFMACHELLCHYGEENLEAVTPYVNFMINSLTNSKFLTNQRYRLALQNFVMKFDVFSLIGPDRQANKMMKMNVNMVAQKVGLPKKYKKIS